LDRRRKEEDLDRLRDFISDHTPHAIVLGAGPGEVDSRRFMEDLKRAASDAEERKNLHYRIHVAYADSRLAKIFKNSFRSLKEFPDYAPLARSISFPSSGGISVLIISSEKQWAWHVFYRIRSLNIVASTAMELRKCSVFRFTLCSSWYPLDCMHLYNRSYHSHQWLLIVVIKVPKEVLHHHLLRTFIDVVNEVGLDINHALRHKFAAGPLQFVAGLGPRKAQALLQALERKVGRVHLMIIWPGHVM